MPKSRIKRFFLKFFSLLRIMMVAWMVGIANSMKQENRFMDDTNYRVETRAEINDDDPFDDLDEEEPTS